MLDTIKEKMNRIDQALSEVERIVLESGNENDRTYFNYHRTRFKKMAESVMNICEPGGTVLDIGSHFLHSSLLLSFLGYKMICMDVQAFWDIGYIHQRAITCGLTIIVENDLEKMNSLDGMPNSYDLILFTEIFEHITFNPLSFWKKIHAMVKDKGVIYITTPNSLTIYGIAKALFNLVRLKGIGIDVNAIFDNVTYGHHWKEYSAGELKAYFKKMNDGFQVSINTFYYKSFAPNDLKSRFRLLLMNIGNRIPFFYDAIEAIVRVDKSHPWKIETPAY